MLDELYDSAALRESPREQNDVWIHIADLIDQEYCSGAADQISSGLPVIGQILLKSSDAFNDVFEHVLCWRGEILQQLRHGTVIGPL